jgi:Ca2+-binding EF-hand superfamily protein
MYDVDGGGYIDLGEMTKLLQSIFTMMGPGATKREPPAVTARAIFRRMDLDKDGKVTREEFVETCLADQKLIELLTPKET